MRQEAGYTLLELLVVLVIISILIASVPGIALPGVTALRFSGTVQTLVARLNYAHEQAIDTGQIVILKPASLAVAANGLALKTADSEIVFFPDGSAEGDNIVVASGAQRRTLRIDAITGRISVLNGG